MNTLLLVFAMLSEWHIVLALIVLFLLFGGKKLPELAKGIGEAIKQFKKAQRDITSDDQRPTEAPPTPPAEQRPEVTSTTAPASKPKDPKLN